MSDDHAERAETEELMELPPTMENLDAKLNHIITHQMVTERLCHRAATASEESKALAEQARAAAVAAGNNALKAVQSREPLSRRERFSTVFAGAAIGGVLAQVALWVLGIGTFAAAISSCGH